MVLHCSTLFDHAADHVAAGFAFAQNPGLWAALERKVWLCAVIAKKENDLASCSVCW